VSERDRDRERGCLKNAFYIKVEKYVFFFRRILLIFADAQQQAHNNNKKKEENNFSAVMNN